MIAFFKKGASTIYAVDTDHILSDSEIEKLTWLFDGAKAIKKKILKGTFIGPRREMITP